MFGILLVPLLSISSLLFGSLYCLAFYWCLIFETLLLPYIPCSGLAYDIYSEGGPSMYLYCLVCYRVIVALYVRSVGHVFAYPYTLDHHSEHPIDYETALLPKVVPLKI